MSGKRKKTMVFIALGLLVLVLATPIVVGLFLPERYEGSTVVSFAEPPEEVWGALMDYESHPMTGRMGKSFEQLPDRNGLPSWTEDVGRGEVITVTTVDLEEPRRLVRDMASSGVPMTSHWVYELERAGDGSCVTVTGTTDIKSGSPLSPFFRFMMVVGGGVEKGLDISNGDDQGDARVAN